MVRSTKFLSPEVALYLNKSTIRPCCHVWAGTPSCYLELLDKLQATICRTVGPPLATSLEDVIHLNWLNWFHPLFLEGGLLVQLSKFASKSANAEAFAEAYLCFLVSASTKKMSRELNCSGILKKYIAKNKIYVCFKKKKNVPLNKKVICLSHNFQA